jgi:hypothetical protein
LGRREIQSGRNVIGGGHFYPSPPVNREIRFGRQKKKPGMSGIPSQFYVPSFKSPRSISRSLKLAMKKRVNRAGNCGNRRNRHFVVTQKKLFDSRRNIQIFGSLHKKKRERGKRKLSKIVWGELSADNANGNTRQQ